MALISSIKNSSFNFYHEYLDFNSTIIKNLEDRIDFCFENLNKKREKFNLFKIPRDEIKVIIDSNLTDDANFSHLLLEYESDEELVKLVSVPTKVNDVFRYKGFCIRHDKVKDYSKVKNLREFNRYFGNYFNGHDKETSNHRNRVGFLTKNLVKLMYEEDKYTFLDNNFLTNHYDLCFDNPEIFANYLYFSARNHDDGKVFIPHGILNKPGFLNDMEFSYMKEHVHFGNLLLRDLPGLEIGREIATYHHETYDGVKGYIGIEGAEIPLSAQITSFVDILDALTTPRVYRKGNYYDYDEAYNMLFNNFDDNFRNKSYSFEGVFSPQLTNFLKKEEIWSLLINSHKKAIKKCGF